MAFLASLPGASGWAALALPIGYLTLVAILALVAALSKRPSRREAAYRVLQLIWWSRRSPDNGNEDTTGPSAPPNPRRRR